jgi:hypothetical protein
MFGVLILRAALTGTQLFEIYPNLIAQRNVTLKCMFQTKVSALPWRYCMTLLRGT